LQGDIIESGSSTSFGASHKYDAWGAVTETVLGSSTNAANFQYGYIFGYRGYQYDKEVGLFYITTPLQLKNQSILKMNKPEYNRIVGKNYRISKRN